MEILVVLHDGCNYDQHFIIKELTEEFEQQFEWLGGNTEKYITFSVPIKNGKTITYKIIFIDSAKFMVISVWSLADNIADGRHKDKCKNCKSGLQYGTVNDGSLLIKFAECKENYNKEFDEDLFKWFKNTYRFHHGDINKSSLMLRKVFYIYAYMNS